ncbi:MAG: c-type cytochrome [Methylococcales bacterium]|nr:c-type cytochrome [Methylococcales bacterium]
MIIRKQIIQSLTAMSLVGLCQIGMADEIKGVEIAKLNLSETLELTLEQQLGKKIFFDTNLSSPAGQSCASCHDIKTSLSDPIKGSPVSFGVARGKTGSRNTPSIAYSAFIPSFHFDKKTTLYTGGQFLDGRVADLTEQAKHALLNPDEMNNADAISVIKKIKDSKYSELFKAVYGEKVFEDSDDAYNKLARAIVAFENSPSFNQFSSKYDYYLDGLVELSPHELHGLAVFEDETKGNCGACHSTSRTTELNPLFTDFSYDNLGVPSNPEILALKGTDFIDIGLGETIKTDDDADKGKFKVPTLRNIAKTAPYMHNGVFSSLREVVDFYNTRDVDSKWPTPEVAENMNTEELGDLKLTEDDISALIAFMRTLTDGYPLQEKLTFSGKTGVVNIPYVRVDEEGQTPVFYSAELQDMGEGIYDVTSLDEREVTDFSLLKAMPYYSSNTMLLEFPLVINSDTGDSEAYVAQLKLIATESKNPSFKLLYYKKLQ